MYGMFRTVAAMGADLDFNLDRLMAKTTDFHTNSNADEANTDNHALWGERQEKGKGTYIRSNKRKQPDGGHDTETRPMCTNCKRPWHTSDKCFAPGGGLSHYSHDERHAYLNRRKKEREGNGSAVVAYQGGGDTTELERMRAENKRIKDQVEEMGYKTV
jgi:hypothetical protein